MLRIVDNLLQAVEVSEQEVRTLIGSETATETNHQRLRVNALQDAHHLSRIALVAQPLLGELITDVFDELLLQGHARAPDFVIGNIVDGMPNALVALVIKEIGIKILVIDLAPLSGRPSREVHTIGDIADMVFLRIVARPNGREHLLADPAMKLTHTVDLLTGVAGEGRHAETLAMIIGILATHADELIPRDAEQLGIATHVFAKEGLIEVVVASGHWRVDSVERRSTHQLQCLVEGKTLLHIVAQTLQVAEGSVAFVAVVNVFLDTELLEHEHTADAKEDLLLQAVFPIATIKGVGDGLVKLRVHVIVGVEQIELHTTYVDLPHKGMDLIVHVGHVDDNLVAVLIEHTLDRKRIEILGIIVGNLLSVHAERLLEVAIAIKEANGAHVHIAV